MRRSLSGPIERVRDEVEEENVHRYQFKASSDSPVEMWGRVFEILDHAPESIRLDWLSSGNAPMLGMHNRYDQVGVVESAELEGNHIVVTVRIAPSQKDLIEDLKAGVVRNVSIGYRVHDEKLESRETDENGNTTRSTWRVIEAEPSAVFADFGVPAHLRKKDGSASVTTDGLYDEADTEFPTEQGSIRSRQPQITVPIAEGQNYGEGDTVEMEGKTYEILDAFSDNLITT